MTIEWTREKTLALIQGYKKRRGLWDMTHEDYRKKDVKNKLLEEVGESLGGNTPIVEVEKKFHTLRTQYHREINRMKRKEPYNSKWFGFKCLQFLSSPKACRSRGRIKAEITEEGTVTKYIIPETITPNHHDGSMGSGPENEEFVTLQRRPTTITYEAVATANAATAATNRSHELEKLIEETTKDVDEMEDSKPKMTLKQISLPLGHHHQPQQQHHHVTEAYGAPGSSDELQISNVESEQDEMHHMEDVGDNIDPIHINTPSEEDMSYQNTSGVSGVNASMGMSTPNAPTTATVHAIPARIVKIQRRDTHHDQNNHYYDHQQHHSQQHHHTPTTQQHHIQAMTPANSTTATKRFYYDASGHHTATILTAAPSQQQTPSSGMAILGTTPQMSPQSAKIQVRASLASLASAASPGSSSSATAGATPTSASSQLRDDCTIYGEYVANEIRCIKNREILIALKHKINTALFEANMQELQK